MGGPGPVPGMQPGAYAAPPPFPRTSSPFAPPQMGPVVDGGSLATWGPRAGAYLIDWALIMVPFLVLSMVLGSMWHPFVLIATLYALIVSIWFPIRVGSTGQSPGMRFVGLRCVSTQTGQPVGGGKGFLRCLCHVLCYFGFVIGFVIDMLFPLWDSQRQTLADKMLHTVVVRVPKQPFSLRVS